MVKEISIREFFQYRNKIPVVDVRSPSEFMKGHIPGSYNIPLFLDEERARVGTTYKQKGKDAAVKLGLEIAGPKMLSLAMEAEQLAGKRKELIVHCWRGGMRSANMAWLFSRLGIQCYTLEGGYKSYRRFGRRLIQQPLNLLVLGGMTGSGKTEILEELEILGEQVLKLEDVAHHKGSAFGAIGQEKQHETEHFENLLFEQFLKFDFSKPVWVEDESKNIGKNCIPDELFHQMRQSPVLKIVLPKEKRIQRLVSEYSNFGDKHLKESIHKIDKRLGGETTQSAIRALKEKNYSTVADIVLTYYDKAYNFGLSKRNGSTVYPLNIEKDEPESNARYIKDYADKNLAIKASQSV